MRFSQSPKYRKHKWMVGLVSLGVLGLGPCKHSQPNAVFMPDMVYSPAIKAQEEGNRLPPQGTVPQGYQAFAYPSQAASVNEAAGRELKNPLKPTPEVLARGKAVFDTYCMACHGPAGEGDGTIVPRFPRPPSLQADKIRGWKDGQIFHIVSVGRNLMPSYATQVEVGDRWAAIHYIRALQRSKHPSAEDLQAATKSARGGR